MTTTEPPLPSLKLLTALQLGIGGGLAALVGLFGGSSLGASFAIGAFIMLANSALLGWTWWRLIAKKSIAWTSLVIVIKYAVLLGSIAVLARTSWFSPLGAGLGIASFLISALALAVIFQKREV